MYIFGWVCFITICIYLIYLGCKQFNKDYDLEKQMEDTEEYLKKYRESRISEPVISFVECVINDPKRFKIMDIELSGDYDKHGFIYDKSEKITFTYKRYKWYHGDIRSFEPAYITPEEFQYCVDKLSPIFEFKKLRLDYIKEIRKQRVLDRQREDLKKIYCN